MELKTQREVIHMEMADGGPYRTNLARNYQNPGLKNSSTEKEASQSFSDRHSNYAAFQSLMILNQLSDCIAVIVISVQIPYERFLAVLVES